MESVRIHAGSISFTSKVHEDPDLRKQAERSIGRAFTIYMSISFAGFFMVFNSMTGKLLLGLKPRGTFTVFVTAVSLLFMLAGSMTALFRDYLAKEVQKSLLKKMQEDGDPQMATLSSSILLNLKRTDAIHIPGNAGFTYVNKVPDGTAVLSVIDDMAVREIDFDNKEEFMAFEEARRARRDILLTADNYL